MPAQGKTNASRVSTMDRILVRMDGDHVTVSPTKTGEGVQVARVNTKEFRQAQRYGGRGTYTLHTSAGVIRGLVPIQTMWLAPEDAAGVKRAHAEALAEDLERTEAARHAKTREVIREAEELCDRMEAKYPELKPEPAAEPVKDVRRMDVVTIHRGDRLYEVLQVSRDSGWDRIRQVRVDHSMALVAPCDPKDGRDPQWVSLDLLHVRKPVADLWTVQARYDRRARYTEEILGVEGVGLRRPALMTTDPQRQPTAHLMKVEEVRGLPTVPVATMKVGDAVVLDGRCFRLVEEEPGKLELEPAPWRARLRDPQRQYV